MPDTFLSEADFPPHTQAMSREKRRKSPWDALVKGSVGDDHVAVVVAAAVAAVVVDVVAKNCCCYCCITPNVVGVEKLPGSLLRLHHQQEREREFWISQSRNLELY